MSVVLYTTHCPKCTVLQTKLDQSNIKYTICDNIDDMQLLNIMSAPALEVNHELLDFSQALKWLREVNNAN